MVGAGDPVRGPHPIRASGQSVKDDSSPVRGPHPVRASGQEKEIQGGMVGKKEWRCPEEGSLLVVLQRVIPRRPPPMILPYLSLNASDALRATRAE